MTASLQGFEATLTTAKSFTIIEEDESAVTLHLDPLMHVSRAGTVLRVWKSEDRSVQMAYALRRNRGERVVRMLCIASMVGSPPPHIGSSLAEVFMPDDTVIVEYKPFKPGWPLALVVSDFYSVVRPASRRPGRD